MAAAFVVVYSYDLDRFSIFSGMLDILTPSKVGCSNLMTEATLVATLFAPPTADGKELSSLPGPVQWLEVRADLVGDLDPDWLRSHFNEAGMVCHYTFK